MSRQLSNPRLFSDNPLFQRTQDVRNRNTESEKVPLPTDPSGFYTTLMSETDLVLAKKRFVKVSGIGEVTIEPDHVEFVIQIITIKPSLIDARTSIKKREEYILAAMKKNHIRDIEILPNETMKRVNSENPEDDELDGPFQGPGERDDQTRYEPPVPKYFKLCKELHVHCDSLIKFLQVYSICNEKLDKQVTMSQPVIKFTPDLLQLTTQRAMRQAMTVAQATASELVGSHRPANVTLGSLIYAVQDSCTTSTMSEYANSPFESFKWKGFNKRINCKITVVYEILAKQMKRVV